MNESLTVLEGRIAEGGENVGRGQGRGSELMILMINEIGSNPGHQDGRAVS